MPPWMTTRALGLANHSRQHVGMQSLTLGQTTFGITSDGLGISTSLFESRILYPERRRLDNATQPGVAGPGAPDPAPIALASASTSGEKSPKHRLTGSAGQGILRHPGCP